jgi:hypothetical protein
LAFLEYLNYMNKAPYRSINGETKVGIEYRMKYHDMKRCQTS